MSLNEIRADVTVSCTMHGMQGCSYGHPLSEPIPVHCNQCMLESGDMAMGLLEHLTVTLTEPE